MLLSRRSTSPPSVARASLPRIAVASAVRADAALKPAPKPAPKEFQTMEDVTNIERRCDAFPAALTDVERAFLLSKPLNPAPAASLAARHSTLPCMSCMS